ncbi:MAG: protein translocase subunit SecDF [Salibacteraceae bacterium]
MQNKSAIWVFTILLIVACFYQLSFSFVTSSVESSAKADAQAQLDSLLSVTDTLRSEEEELALQRFEQKILQKMNSEEVYPILNFTYAYCKQNEINLGLDLQGGMNVTLQVSVRDLIKALSDNSEDPLFIQTLQRASELQRNSQEDYVTLFDQAWNEVNPTGKMAGIFHNRENKDMFPLEATNEEILNTISEQAEAAVSRTEQVLRRRIDGLGVVQPSIQRQAGTGRIIVELPGVKDKERVRKILQGTAQLEFWYTYDNGEIYTKMEAANTMLAERLSSREKQSSSKEEGAEEGEVSAEDLAADEAVVDDEEVVADSNEAEEEEGALVLEGQETSSDTGSGIELSDDSLAQLRADYAENNPLFNILRPAIYQDPDDQKYYAGKGPTVGYASIYDTADINVLLKRKDFKQNFPRRTKFLWAAKPYDEDGKFLQLYAINVTDKDEKAPLEGDVITDARVQSDALGNPEIGMSMNSEGAKIWKAMTAEAAAQTPSGSIAIVLDDKVYSAPRVENEIAGGNSSIMGQFTLQEAEDLANVLKAGKLPAPARIIEEAVVGPTLGREAIQSGLISFVIALLLILAYMAFYYSSAGIVADLALLANLFFVVGVLASLGATLTLPGIAGIVLTIGMSVDANVLIYERIREELRAGKGVRLAIVDGYKNAYSSIIDANITTLLTGIILYIFGSGPIKGFATTLIIGIATSLFAAIFITRLLFEWRLENNAKPSFATKLTENVMTNVALPFVKKRRLYYMISGVVILIGLGSLFTQGLNYGVDFTGGRTYTVRFDEAYPVSDIASALSAQFIDEQGLKQTPEVKTYGVSNQVKITTKYMIDSEAENTDQIVEDKLNAGLSAVAQEYTVMSSQKVGPTIADDIRSAAWYSAIFALLIIFVYIVIRFRKWQFGLGALVAMIHDVLIVLSLFSLLYRFMPFSLEIDQAFIAAILTVVGYSINDTVVVFDRIREYLGIHKRKDHDGVINEALNSTLSRTINTSLSTLVVLLMIFFFGGEVIRGFVFALIIGVIVGTYSSLCVATPVVVDLTRGKNK